MKKETDENQEGLIDLEKLQEAVPELVTITTIAQFGLMDEDIELFSKLMKKVIIESRRAGFRNDWYEFKGLCEDIYANILTQTGLEDLDLNLP